ncbi:MAG TPA: HrpF/NolX family T3SS translocon protein, partial [Acidobacteriaceae bacterium]
MKTEAGVFDTASKVAGFVGSLNIPEVSQLAKAAAVGDKAIAGLANIGTTAIEGGNVGKAAKDAGIGLGETAVGSVIPGGGAKAITGLADVAGRVAKQG